MTELLNGLKITIGIALIGLSINSCVSKQNDYSIQQLVNEYYQVYQSRTDFQKFLSFYDENMVLEDVILGKQIANKTEFAKFFDWKNPNFSKRDSVALVISEQIIERNQVVTMGYFTSFNWGNDIFEAMHFTTLLIFNENGKIQKQVDWINYPNNLVDYNSRKNSNDWIPMNRKK